MPIAASTVAPADPQDGQSASSCGLVLVSTPIGNLGDISERARKVLCQSDLVLCEDTRRTGTLLSMLRSSVRMEALHEHNEDDKIHGVIEQLRDGRTVSLVSDAGTPLVSDPGYRLVRAVIAAGLPVTAVPGPNAAIMALTLSGLPPLPFMVVGFPPPKRAARLASFGALRAAERAGFKATLIWHEAPHRLLETLSDLAEIFGNRYGVVARELTKRFETVERGALDQLMTCFQREPPRGEITILIGPSDDEDPEDLDERLKQALADQSVKDAAATVSVATGLPRKLVYSRALELMAAARRDG